MKYYCVKVSIHYLVLEQRSLQQHGSMFMTKNIIGFFCGAEFTRKTDKLYEGIYSHVSDAIYLSYDGCSVRRGGFFTFGVENQANVFISDLKKEIAAFDNDEDIQINFIAHLEGCFSALLAIKRIQADLELRTRIRITMDLHEPSPRNFQWSTAIGGNLIIANKVRDLSDCEIIKKVYITLQEKERGGLGWDALVPKFHAITKVDVELIPGCYDVQHSGQVRPEFDHIALFQLGQAKALDILAEDEYNVGFKRDDLKRQQINAYAELLDWARERATPFGERTLHFGGRFIVHNDGRNKLEAINWRHAQLIAAVPEHVLYSMTHPHYNYKKSEMECYCDLILTLDEYLRKHPEQCAFIQKLRHLAQQYAAEGYTDIGLKNFHVDCERCFVEAEVYDKQLYIGINLLCMHGYFLEFENILQKIPKDNILYTSLVDLKSALMEELASEIHKGLTIQAIREAYVLKVAKNTVDFLSLIYTEGATLENINKAFSDYITTNLPREEHRDFENKNVAILALSIAAAAIGCLISTLMGFSLGLTIGTVLSFELVAVTIFSVFEYIETSVEGIYLATEKHIQALANAAAGEEGRTLHIVL